MSDCIANTRMLFGAMLDKVVVAVQNAVKLAAEKATAELDERTPAWTKYVTDKAMNEELVKEDLLKKTQREQVA